MSNSWFRTRTECPACASPRFTTIYENRYDRPPLKDYLLDFYSPQGRVEFEYLDGVSYVLCECAACALIFQGEIPAEPLMNRLYDHWIDAGTVFQQHQEQDDLRYHLDNAREILQVIGYLDRPPSALRFCDYGMGWGKWALMAKAFGCDSYGTELSIERIRHAQSNAIKVVAPDELPPDTFDFINTEQVFEHLPDPLEVLRRLKRSLTPRGLVKVSVPPGDDIARRLKIMNWKAPKGSRDSLNPVAPLEHINCFRRTSLLAMATAAGMEEARLPAAIQYRYATDWGSARSIAKNLLRPLYRTVFVQPGYVYLRNARSLQ